MNELLERLRVDGPRLSARVIGEMYADPFWLERFGPRGNGHASADGDFHVKYLVAALEADDPGVFANYARWLRDLLVARGMCSLHLRDNFLRLARAIAAEGWPAGAAAVGVLEAGASALAHDTGDAAAVEAARADVERAAAALANGAGDGAADAGAELQHLASFLADSLAGASDRLGPHVAFLRRMHAALRIAPRRLDAQLAALAAIPGLPERARELIERARGAGGAEATP